MLEDKRIRFLRTTLIGGVVFLLPFGALVWVGKMAVDVMLVVARPMAAFLPVDTIGGVALANLLALAAVVLLCFGAGLAARATFLAHPVRSFEQKVLEKIPGYVMIRGVATSLHPEELHGLGTRRLLFGDDTTIEEASA